MSKQNVGFPFQATFALALVAIAMLFVSPIAFAQSATSGAVVGTITDATGAVVPNAEVQLVNVDTNASQTQNTNATGGYVFPSVPPGNYTIHLHPTDPRQPNNYRQLASQQTQVTVSEGAGTQDLGIIKLPLNP